jgi:hypothetical protein
VVTSLCALPLCGIPAGCAESAAVPIVASAPVAAAARLDTPNSAFAESTASPRPVTAQSPDPDARTLSAACGESDQALLTIATQLAEQRTDRATDLDADAIGYALRAAGAPYVWPRAWLFNGNAGDVEVAKARMQRWLAGFGDGGTRRCGVSVRHKAGQRISVGAVAVDVLADLEPLPTRVRIGEWLDVRATLRVPASDAKLVILGPHGAPHAVPTSFSDGRVRARFNADQAGPWLVQLLAAVDGGPRPLLEALLFAGVEPPAVLSVPKAPGEDAAQANADPSTALSAMVNAARASEGLPLLQRDTRLEALAQAHAEAMRRARRTAHDAGDGDLNQRLEQVGLELAAGENVAHAGSAVLAQRALWASPSHRENLLDPAFDLLGIGVAPDADGTLWVCQVFGTSH